LQPRPTAHEQQTAARSAEQGDRHAAIFGAACCCDRCNHYFWHVLSVPPGLGLQKVNIADCRDSLL
jgi:hypothetical protein